MILHRQYGNIFPGVGLCAPRVLRFAGSTSMRPRTLCTLALRTSENAPTKEEVAIRRTASKHSSESVFAVHPLPLVMIPDLPPRICNFLLKYPSQSATMNYKPKICNYVIATEPSDFYERIRIRRITEVIATIQGVIFYGIYGKTVWHPQPA